SSVARLLSTAGAPFQRQAMRNRASAFDSTGSVSAASPQDCPPSADTSTFRIFPCPDQASPEISYIPGPFPQSPAEGAVITDFTSIGNVNISDFPLGNRSVYLDVSSLVMVGSAVTLMRRSHLTFILPS